MKHTDFYSQAQAIKTKSIQELAAALKAHGGTYTWRNPEPDDDEENEDDDDLPCIAFNLDYAGPQDVIVLQASVSDEGHVSIIGRPKDGYDDDTQEYDPYEAFASHIEFLIDMIPETDKVHDVSLPQEFFEISSVAREDLEEKGYDTSNVTDAQMRNLAKRLGNAYVENEFWIDLEIIADYLEIPKHTQHEE